MLPVINQQSGKTEDRYAAKIQQEMEDRDTESETEEANEDDVDDSMTPQKILEIQNEINSIWPKRLANVSLASLICRINTGVEQWWS